MSRKKAIVTIADIQHVPASVSRAGVILCVVWWMIPTNQGLTKPPRLPTELINAMPPAAADPDK